MYKKGKISSVLAPRARQLHWRGPIEIRLEKEILSAAFELPKRLAAAAVLVRAMMAVQRRARGRSRGARS